MGPFSKDQWVDCKRYTVRVDAIKEIKQRVVKR